MTDTKHTGTQGGSHDQHVKAGEQSHKNTGSQSSSARKPEENEPSTRGGTHDQHVKAGQQSHKNS